MELTNDMIKSLNIDVSIISDSDLEDSDLKIINLELVFEENNDLINRLLIDKLYNTKKINFLYAQRYILLYINIPQFSTQIKSSFILIIKNIIVL